MYIKLPKLYALNVNIKANAAKQHSPIIRDATNGQVVTKEMQKCSHQLKGKCKMSGQTFASLPVDAELSNYRMIKNWVIMVQCHNTCYV